MKLFIDTSNKKIILATLDYANRVTNYSVRDTNNDMVKIAVQEVNDFLKRSNEDINEITEYMFTIGPGSYTGVKVAMNIVSSINLVKPIEKYHIIDSFNLIERDNYMNTAIPFGKSKFYVRKLKSSKIDVLTNKEIKELESVNYGYDNFTRELLQEKIDNKSFKIVDNLDKVKIKYLSTF